METNIDLHCHSSMKPFGLASPGITNSKDASLKNSIWYDDPPSPNDEVLCNNDGITRFSQSNFAALHDGNFKVVVAALNPIEKGFFPEFLYNQRKSHRRLFIDDFLTGIGKKKISFIQKNKDDFNELNCEYNFYRQLHNTEIMVYGKKVRYRLTNNYNDIYNNIHSSDDVMSVVLSIEGGNLFNSDNSQLLTLNSILPNVLKVKNWEYPPFFVTLCHHFYNHLAGHAKSLPDFISKILNDTPGMDTNITMLGKAVIHSLLSKSNGKRIYIDIKHMSRLARITYYKILKENYGTEKIPIIVSHGALNGYPELNDSGSPPNERNGLFNGRDINFYDNEIVMIEKSDGIFGLQLDKRQITNKCEARKIKYLCCKKKKPERWIRLVWNQIQHIADLLDSKNLPAWDIISLGTDFDGIVSPFVGCYTSAEIPRLRHKLYYNVYNYVNNKSFNVRSNKMAPNDILDKIFWNNALDFFSKYY